MKRALHSQKRRRGFTLIEMMIVVAIIGILAMVAFPNFYAIQVKSKRAEAFVALKQLYAAEISFQPNSGYFTTSLHLIGYTLGAPPTNNNLHCVEGSALACGRFYSVYVGDASIGAFIGYARGKPDPGAPPR